VKYSAVVHNGSR